MSKTTIEVPESTRDKLKEARLPHESNYGNTIERLLNEGNGGQLWTEQEIKSIVESELNALKEELSR